MEGKFPELVQGFPELVQEAHELIQKIPDWNWLVTVKKEI